VGENDEQDNRVETTARTCGIHFDGRLLRGL